MPYARHLTLLTESLRGHNLAFKERDLQEALGSQDDPNIHTWIDEHLGLDTLLSKEELSLYSALQKSGEIEALTSSQDLSITSDVSDLHIQNVIEQLQKSTAAIEKHTETLTAQQEVVASLLKENGKHHTDRAAAENTQHRVWVMENNQTSSAIDELLQNLKYQTAELSTQCKAADVVLRKTTSEMLRLDDKLLVGLQKLGSDLDPGCEDEDGIANRVRDLCARLIKYTVEAVRARLDRVYLEATNGNGDALKGMKSTDNAEVTTLLDELESLYTEILPVAQMSAEQQYLEPALCLIASRNVQGGDRSSTAIEFVRPIPKIKRQDNDREQISKCLSDLIERLQDITAQIEEYRHYRTAIMLMTSAVKAELDTDRPPSPKPKPGSSARIRKQSKPISPVRPRNTRRSSATSFDDDVNPKLQILRNLGISLPAEPSGDRNIAATFQDVLGDRIMKLYGHSMSLQEVSEASIGSHLHDSQVTLQLLMESLLSETPYKTVNLLDTEVQEAMDRLEWAVEEVKRDVAVVSLDPLRERNVRRDDLVERWAR